MRRIGFYFVLAALVMIGGLIGFFLSSRPAGLPAVGPAAQMLPGPAPRELSQWQDAALANGVAGAEQMPDLPPGAVPGEYVLHFSTREAYLAYLAALRATGAAPLNQIDALLAVRIPQHAVRLIPPGQYGAQADFSYIVAHPLPPADIDPAALATLRAYGMSPRSIVGGELHGDGTGVLVAVLDSGIDAHPVFDDLVLTHLNLVDGHVATHGTSVASIIAGTEGIAPKVSLLDVRVLDDEGKGSSYHVAEGIVAAVDQGAKIINLSLGVYQDSLLLRQAVSYAHEQGVLLVAAPGNDSYDRMSYPAAYENVLSVTAVDARGSYALFPNQSADIDFAAPGVGILTAKEDTGTTFFSGTSAAAPFVSGTLASLMSGERALSANDAVQVLRSYLNEAGAPGPDPEYGAGVLDWSRLRERTTPDIQDVALAAIHLSPDAQPGTNMPIEVTVQNRGTQWLNAAQLEVRINDGEPVSFSIGTLGPGQITTRKVYALVPSQDSGQALNLAARVLPRDLNQDVRLENNLQAVQFRPR